MIGIGCPGSNGGSMGPTVFYVPSAACGGGARAGGYHPPPIRTRSGSTVPAARRPCTSGRWCDRPHRRSLPAPCLPVAPGMADMSRRDRAADEPAQAARRARGLDTHHQDRWAGIPSGRGRVPRWAPLRDVHLPPLGADPRVCRPAVAGREPRAPTLRGIHLGASLDGRGMARPADRAGRYQMAIPPRRGGEDPPGEISPASLRPGHPGAVTDAANSSSATPHHLRSRRATLNKR